MSRWSRWSRWKRCQKEGNMMPRVMRCPKWQGHKMGTRCPKQWDSDWVEIQFNDVIILPPREQDWDMTHQKYDVEQYIRRYWINPRFSRRKMRSEWSEEKLKTSERRWKDFRNPRIYEKCGLHKHSSVLVSKILKCIFGTLRCVRCRFWSRKWIQRSQSSQEWLIDHLCSH